PRCVGTGQGSIPVGITSPSEGSVRRADSAGRIDQSGPDLRHDTHGAAADARAQGPVAPLMPTADQLRADAERYLREHVFGDASLAKALTALEEAAGLDPEDRNGETATLLGKVCFQLQEWDSAV